MSISLLTTFIAVSAAYSSGVGAPPTGGYEPQIGWQNAVAANPVNTSLAVTPRQSNFLARLAIGSKNAIEPQDTGYYTFQIYVIDAYNSGTQTVTAEHLATAADVIRPSSMPEDYEVPYLHYYIAPIQGGNVYGILAAIPAPGIANGDIDYLQFLNANQNIDLKLTYLRGGTYAVQHPVKSIQFRVPASGESLLTNLKMAHLPR